ncbi:MAG TPA: hypothetical protein ENN77_01550 [Candidatus Wirthbacteria bacterium]|nr:hypothetical protein [Candidatus Wirthbacteria bacterium]
MLQGGEIAKKLVESNWQAGADLVLLGRLQQVVLNYLGYVGNYLRLRAYLAAGLFVCLLVAMIVSKQFAKRKKIEPDVENPVPVSQVSDTDG